MSKRLKMLEAMTEGGSKDPFTWYALAMEYKNEERYAEAVQAFGELHAIDPGYLPMYLMAGQALSAASQNHVATLWLQQGREVAKQKGDEKALSEIEALLEELSGSG